MDNLNRLLVTLQKCELTFWPKKGQAEHILQMFDLSLILGLVGDKIVSSGLGIGCPFHYFLKGMQGSTEIS